MLSRNFVPLTKQYPEYLQYVLDIHDKLNPGKL